MSVLLRPATTFDLHRSFSLQALGRVDPTARFDGDATFLKRVVTREGVLEVTCRVTGAGLEAAASGPGAEAWLEAWRLRLAAHVDDGARFAPEHRVVKRLHAQFSGLALLPMPWLFDVACGAVLQQRITFGEACGQFAAIAKRYGPGGAAFPSAQVLRDVPSFELRALGIDEQRGRTLRALAKLESVHPFLDVATPADEVVRRLSMVPGIGPWTIGMVRGFGLGEADALIPGDVNLPHLVCFALARETPGTDARMLELLAPFEGHRFRVVRLLYAGGLSAPAPRR
jgi:3-methyladenine DNA glycosylase/8-oxoguanine DNA glycosylase